MNTIVMIFHMMFRRRLVHLVFHVVFTRHLKDDFRRITVALVILRRVDDPARLFCAEKYVMPRKRKLYALLELGLAVCNIIVRLAVDRRRPILRPSLVLLGLVVLTAHRT